MKALSLWQPWASLVAIGEKEWETRSWEMKYRGLLAIHAAKKVGDPEQGYALDSDEIKEALWNAGFKVFGDLPRGSVLCIVRVVDCLPTVKAISQGLIDRNEKRFGDYSPGRFCTRLEMVEVFKSPIPARGAQGLWDWAGMPARQEVAAS